MGGNIFRIDQDPDHLRFRSSAKVSIPLEAPRRHIRQPGTRNAALGYINFHAKPENPSERHAF
jgi:hypothetical protein